MAIGEGGSMTWTCHLIAALVISSASRVQADDWPQWLGPSRDGHVSDMTLRLEALPKEPKVAWRLPIGGGFSSPVIARGKLLYLDAQNGKEVAHLLDASTGKEL